MSSVTRNAAQQHETSDKNRNQGRSTTAIVDPRQIKDNSNAPTLEASIDHE